MSTEPENQYQPQNPYEQPQPVPYGYSTTTNMPVPPQAPKKPSKLKRFGLPVGLLLLGLVIGTASGAAAKPEPVVEVQVQEKIVEKRVEVPRTPQSCLTAIDKGEAVIQSAGRVAGIFGQIIDAVKTMDAATIYKLNPKLDAETEILNGIKPQYQSARDACRASK